MAEKLNRVMNFLLPKEEADEVKRVAESMPYRDTSKFIREAIREKIEREKATLADGRDE